MSVVLKFCVISHTLSMNSHLNCHHVLIFVLVENINEYHNLFSVQQSFLTSLHQQFPPHLDFFFLFNLLIFSSIYFSGICEVSSFIHFLQVVAF